jgi:ribonuclease-3
MVTFLTKERAEQLVDTKIKNLDLYQRAFTHKSALKEYEQFTESFETLEFIGDSVLGFVITKFLFDRHESKQEGFLTKALIGAIYMDIGLLHAKEFILRIYQDPDMVDMNSIMVDDNFKDKLMRTCQVNNWQLPDYRVAAHHEGLFYIDIYINNTFCSRGVAKSKKQAEQNAAQMYFQVMEELKSYNLN